MIPVMFYQSNYLNSILHNKVTSFKKEKSLPLQTLNILPMTTQNFFIAIIYNIPFPPKQIENQNFKCFLSPQSYKCFILKFLLLFTLARSSISELKFVSPSIISSSSNVRSSSKSWTSMSADGSNSWSSDVAEPPGKEYFLKFGKSN